MQLFFQTKESTHYKNEHIESKNRANRNFSRVKSLILKYITTREQKPSPHLKTN